MSSSDLYVGVQLPLLLLFYTTSFKNLFYLVHLKSHVVLHGELTGYLLSTKLL